MICVFVVACLKVCAVRGESPPPAADSPEARTLNNLGSLYFQHGDLVKAEALFRQAATLGDPAAPLNLASTLRAEGRYTEAEEAYRRALAAPSAAALEALAELYNDTARYAEAEQMARQALDLRRQTTPTDDAGVATTLNLLGVLATRQERAADAVIFLEQALAAIDHHNPGGNKGLRADILVNLGNAERRKGNLGNAETHLNLALDLVSSDRGTRRAAALTGLSLLARERGDFKQARTLAARAADALREAVGTEHPDYAASLVNLATMEQDLHQDRKARELYTEALRIDEEKLSPDHPRIGADLNNLGVVSARLREYALAESYFLKALDAEGRRDPGGVQLALWTANLAGLYAKQHRDAEALNRFRSATAVLCAKDAGDMRVAGILQQYAGLLRANGSFAEAEDAEARAMHIRVKFALVNPNDARAAGL